MSYNNLISATEAFVQERLAEEATGHDWWHANAVRNVARVIHQTEGGTWEVIEPASLLHDVGDRKVINKPDDDYTIAENFLISQGFTAITIDAIMFVIKNMSFSKSIDGNIDKTLELAITQDADQINAMGAIGVARAFAYGGSKGRPLHDPNYTPQQFTSTAEYKVSQSPTLAHFDEKLFLLKDNLNTETGKKIAESRHAYMREFYERFLAEWNGES